MSERPRTVLIAALGGEGGGVLTSWLVAAATRAGLPVQSTSIPGVAQRTGATTYYVEVWPKLLAAGVEPLFALYPTPGEVDVVAASELIEAGRALENGYVSGQTTLIASTHRVYAIAERSAMGDGRFAGERVLSAARGLSRQAVLADLAAAAREAGAAINAVMLGAIAGAGGLPIPEQAYRDAITEEGKAVAANLAGFDAGLALARGEGAAEAQAPRRAPAPPSALVEGIEPAAVREIAREGVARLADYQDMAYARRYLERLESVLAADPTPDKRLARETARYLALRMAYEDVIRVAQLKTRRERLARVRAEVGAGDSPVRISEFLKPGVEEICALLPGFLARPILNWAARRGLTDRLGIGLAVPTTSVSGFLLLWLLARLRPLRRIGHRFAEEQARIDDWLALIRDAARADAALAGEIVECARLLKGYGETFRRGLANYERIRAALPGADAALVRRAREAALADPQGAALDEALGEQAPTQAEAAE